MIRGLDVRAPLRTLDVSLLTSLPYFTEAAVQDNRLTGPSISDSFCVFDVEPKHVPAAAMNVPIDLFLMHCTALAGGP